jgi:hypothetical protein
MQCAPQLSHSSTRLSPLACPRQPLALVECDTRLPRPRHLGHCQRLSMDPLGLCFPGRCLLYRMLNCFKCEMFSRIQVMRYKPARQLHRQSGILPEWGGEHAPRFLGTLPPISNCLASEHNPTKMYSNRNLPTWYQCLHRLSSPQRRFRVSSP